LVSDGHQHLDGDQTLKIVSATAARWPENLAQSANIPIRMVAKPILTAPETRGVKLTVSEGFCHRQPRPY
jgi:L-arabinose isomerase